MSIALVVIVMAASVVWLAIPLDYPELAAHRRRTQTRTTTRSARHRRTDLEDHR